MTSNHHFIVTKVFFLSWKLNIFKNKDFVFFSPYGNLFIKLCFQGQKNCQKEKAVQLLIFYFRKELYFVVGSSTSCRANDINKEIKIFLYIFCWKLVFIIIDIESVFIKIAKRKKMWEFSLFKQKRNKKQRERMML